MKKRFSKLHYHHKIVFAVIVGTAVVAWWKGVWGLLDAYLFPEHPLFSNLFSIFISIAVLYFANFLTKALDGE